MADLTITVTISDTDQNVLANDLADINAWVQSAVEGKLNNCFKRMRADWTARLMEDDGFSDPIPSNKDDFVAMVIARPNYTNRADRDAAEAAERAAQIAQLAEGAARATQEAQAAELAAQEVQAAQAAQEAQAAEQATVDQAAADQAVADQAARDAEAAVPEDPPVGPT